MFIIYILTHSNKKQSKHIDFNALRAGFLADDIFLSLKIGFDISWICMKCQTLFLGEKKKTVINLSSAEW